MSEAEAESKVAERVVVAIRMEPSGGHSHISRVRLADGTEQASADVIAAIDHHEAHYAMRPPEGTEAYPLYQKTGLPLLIRATQCPDCDARVLWA